METQPQKGYLLRTLMIVLAAAVVLGANASFAATPETTAATTAAQTESADIPAPMAVSDPYEKLNRGIFAMNDLLDTYLLKPVATIYNKIMPKPLNQGVHNVFNNLNTITTIADDILQFEFYQMASDIWRVGINTTLGVGGLFDVASRMNLPYYQNDFGLTMAKWGWKNSIYIVLPFFGPNTLRDGLGLPVDYFAFSVYPYVHPHYARYALYGIAVVDSRAQRLKFQSVMEEASFDKYIFIRNAYLQHRNYQVERNDHRSCQEQIQGNNKVQEYGLNYD